MDISARLEEGEIQRLEDPGKLCGDVVRGLGGSGFEGSLRVKNTVDGIEEIARDAPSWSAFSVLVNCEYRLYEMNRDTPLRNNPFLSHWVEAILRLGQNLAPSKPQGKRRAKKNGDKITDAEIRRVRVELIKSLLQSGDSLPFASMSPKMLYEKFVELGQTTEFDVAVYIRMLQEEGIYDDGPRELDGPSGAHVEASTQQDGEEATSKPRLNDFQQWKKGILSRLETEPEVATQELRHLPVELSYLDFLTTLLQEGTLLALSIDPAPIMSDYIQHALRLAEKMGQPPESSSLNGNSEDIDRGREAQARAVRLLLLFIRNLIRKALLPPEAIYFEIQEICVRYVWIREVREFRAFVEEGAVSEGAGH
ncbi:hypothetical protein BS50DRAFT_588667 [Corynespora cassiicola Philippines]|uniref:Uncharacterized protein n=1 Tax=Corynespora cassiicola Philippines TaxID=1448308 RepID=A0A2T2NK96_CORCC|nr:hypothetical protein BS50DRAFT_588667 [Corynespora cassiicola Philippines]